MWQVVWSFHHIPPWKPGWPSFTCCPTCSPATCAPRRARHSAAPSLPASVRRLRRMAASQDNRPARALRRCCAGLDSPTALATTGRPSGRTIHPLSLAWLPLELGRRSRPGCSESPRATPDANTVVQGLVPVAGGAYSGQRDVCFGRRCVSGGTGGTCRRGRHPRHRSSTTPSGAGRRGRPPSTGEWSFVLLAAEREKKGQKKESCRKPRRVPRRSTSSPSPRCRPGATSPAGQPLFDAIGCSENYPINDAAPRPTACQVPGRRRSRMTTNYPLTSRRCRAGGCSRSRHDPDCSTSHRRAQGGPPAVLLEAVASDPTTPLGRTTS